MRASEIRCGFGTTYDRETRRPHIHRHGVTAREVEEVLDQAGEDRPGKDASRVYGSGMYLRVVCVPEPERGSIFVITSYQLTGKALRAYLEAAEVEFLSKLSVSRNAPIRSVIVTDPGGYAVEFFQRLQARDPNPPQAQYPSQIRQRL